MDNIGYIGHKKGDHEGQTEVQNLDFNDMD